MPRTCTICANPKRKEIEQASLAGQPYRDVAKRFAASSDSVYRHLKAHLPARMAKAAERREVAAGESLLKTAEEAERKEIAAGSSLIDRLLELNKISRAILADSYKAGDRGTALKAVARLEHQLELEARLLGEIKDTQIAVVNLQVQPTEAERIARAYLAAPAPDFVETTAVAEKP
jgi:hypothetical protein